MDDVTRAVRFEIPQPHVGMITLDRPAAANALTLAMWRHVGELAKRCEADRNVRVVVIRGAGGRFCPGVDLKSVNMSASPGGPPPIDFRDYLFAPVLALSKPLIACIDGPAAGGGLGLALACDMRFASTRAKFSTAFARIGVSANDMVAWLLPRVTGMTTALELMYTAETVGAEEALRYRLVNAVHEPEVLEQRVFDVAASIARLAPFAIRLSKRLIVESTNRTAEQHMLAQEYAAMANRSVAAADIAEGVAAFLQKRPAEFNGPDPLAHEAIPRE